MALSVVPGRSGGRRSATVWLQEFILIDQTVVEITGHGLHVVVGGDGRGWDGGWST